MGLQSTLLLKKPQPRFQADKPYVQIVFDRKDHWIVASTLLSRSGQVKVYDSVFTAIDKETKAVISNFYGPEVLPHLVSVNEQKGSTDCDLFAVAIATTLALGPRSCWNQLSPKWSVSSSSEMFGNWKIYYVFYDLVNCCFAPIE